MSWGFVAIGATEGDDRIEKSGWMGTVRAGTINLGVVPEDDDDDEDDEKEVDDDDDDDDEVGDKKGVVGTDEEKEGDKEDETKDPLGEDADILLLLLLLLLLLFCPLIRSNKKEKGGEEKEKRWMKTFSFRWFFEERSFFSCIELKECASKLRGWERGLVRMCFLIDQQHTKKGTDERIAE